MFAYPSYGYGRPTPLYPSNRRPAQPLYARPGYGGYYQNPEEEAYLRALARERAQREAAARAAYNPFGLGGYPMDEDEDEDEVYVPRGRHGYVQDPYLARRQAEHERQLRERELLNRHLAEQRRREQLAQQQAHQRARAQAQPHAHAHAQKTAHAQQQQRKSPSPVRPQPATHHEQPQPKHPQQEKHAPTPEEINAANLIQSTWRAHHLRKKAQEALDRLAEKLDSLKSSFHLPETLDFDPSARAPTQRKEDDMETDTSDEENLIRKLLFNSHNAPVHGYEHALTQLLQELDGVESHGDPEIRGRRKALVGKVEEALRELEAGVRAVWEKQHAQASTSEKQEQPKEEPMKAERSGASERARGDGDGRRSRRGHAHGPGRGRRRGERRHRRSS